MSVFPEPTRDLAVAKANMDDHGYCLLKDALSAEEVSSIRERFLEQVEGEAEIGVTHHLPDKKQIIEFLFNKGKVFRDILFHPGLHQILKHVLGEEYLLSSYVGHIAHPGGKKAFHTDQFWMPPPTTEDKKTLVKPGSITRLGHRGHHVGGDALMHAPTISPAVVCNAMWMLDDFTEANGATIVVPGSHLSGRQPDAELDEGANWVPATGTAGTVVVFEGRTWHSTGANVSNDTRIGLTTNFCAPQFRQQQNFLLGTLPEVLEEASDELLALIGFKPWQGYGGYERGAELLTRGQYALGELKPTHSDQEER